MNAMEYEASQAPCSVDEDRERIVQSWLREHERLIPARMAWTAAAPPMISGLVNQPNGPFMDYMINETGYEDVNLVRDCQRGFPIVGELSFIGVGTRYKPVEKPELTPEELWELRSHINEDIVSSLKDNALSQSVLENTLVDFDHHSMTYPTPLTEEHLAAHVVSRRFGVEQAKEKDGVEYTATRVVDHESESFKNSTVHSMKHQHMIHWIGIHG